MKTKIIIVLLLITSFLCACTTGENKKYTIFYEDGKCYIEFADDIFAEEETESTLSGTSECSTITYPSFDSVIEMKNEILNGELDDSQLYSIRQTAKENNTVEIYDPNKFQIPLLPEGFTFSGASWYGDSYSVRFKGNSSVVGSGSVSCMSEDEYSSLFENNYLNTITEYMTVITDTVVSERNARVVHSKTDTAELQDVFYTLTGANGYTLHIMETYVLRYFIDISRRTSSIAPQSIRMFGTNGENYFYCYLREPEERPSVEWLSSFGLTPLDTSTSS